MEMQFKNEIKKLADVVVWADNRIEGMKTGLTEEEFAEDEEVKAFEIVKKVILESMERHTVYTNALNKDIADKAAKIDLLEKEIAGRKEGYIALKVRMDTKYISVDEHNDVCKAYEKKVAELKKESEKWQDLAKMNRDTICDQYNVCEDFKKKIVELEEKVKHQRENLDGINKTLEIRNKENDSLVKTIQTTRREIEAHEEENKRLSERIMKFHNTITELSHDIDNYKSWNASLHKDIKELKEEVKKRDKCIMEKNAIINTAAKMKEDDYGKSGFKRYIEHLIEEEERAVPERFKERLNKEITEIFTKKEETVKYRPSEIDRFVNFLKEEVDKKRIVDIRYGVEDDLHVTRDLFVAAVKLIVAKGYHEYDGVTTGYGRFHVLTTPDVEFKDLYDTWKIKSIGPDIPCGEDAIE